MHDESIFAELLDYIIVNTCYFELLRAIRITPGKFSNFRT